MVAARRSDVAGPAKRALAPNVSLRRAASSSSISPQNRVGRRTPAISASGVGQARCQHLPPAGGRVAIDGPGQLAASGAVHGADGPGEVGVLVGVGLQPAHAHDGQAQGEGQPLGAGDAHPQAGVAARPDADEHGGQLALVHARALHQIFHRRQQLPRVVSLAAPGELGLQRSLPRQRHAGHVGCGVDGQLQAHGRRPRLARASTSCSIAGPARFEGELPLADAGDLQPYQQVLRREHVPRPLRPLHRPARPARSTPPAPVPPPGPAPPGDRGRRGRDEGGPRTRPGGRRTCWSRGRSPPGRGRCPARGRSCPTPARRT